MEGKSNEKSELFFNTFEFGFIIELVTLLKMQK